MYGARYAFVCLSMPGVRDYPAGWCSHGRWFPVEGSPVTGGASACGFGVLYGPVRGCTQDRRRGWPGARTYSGQCRGRGRHERSFSQVRAHVEVQAGAVCKTVGSAYVGSNPTPATHLRRSKPVTLDCVTGFSAERERLREPSAVSRGLCVGRIRASPGLCGYRLRGHLSCGNTRGGGRLHAVSRVALARWPWAVRGTGDRSTYI